MLTVHLPQKEFKATLINMVLLVITRHQRAGSNSPVNPALKKCIIKSLVISCGKSFEVAMNLIIFGATGGTGHQLMNQALQRGHHVTAFARNPQDVTVYPDLNVVKGDVLNPESIQAAFKQLQVDVVLSAIGSGRHGGSTQICSEGTRHILHAMKKVGMQRFIGISSLGVADEFNNWFVRKIVMGAMLANIHEDLKRMEMVVKFSPLNWTLARPPRLVDGPGTGKYRVLLAPDGRQLFQISRADVADFMINEAENSSYIRQCPGIGY
jgi:putative NADH-flavin reductase